MRRRSPKAPKRSRVARAWARIEAVLAARAPAVFRSLADPVSRARLRELERAFGRAIPRDLVESLSIHDGQRHPSRRLPPLFNGEFLLPASEIVKLSRLMSGMQRRGSFEADASGRHLTRPKEPIRTDLWWRPHWIPFTDENGSYFVSDLDPARGGKRGQVFHHSAHGHSPRRVLASSFTGWLELLADDLDSGRFEVDDEGDVWLSPRSKLTP